MVVAYPDLAGIATVKRARPFQQPPVIASADPGEGWLFCYVEEAFAEY